MSFFYDKDDRTVFAENAVQFGGEDVGFLEGVRLGYNVQKKVDNLDAYVQGIREVYQPIVDLIQDRSGQTFINPGSYFGTSAQPGINEAMRSARVKEIFQHIQENPDLYPEENLQALTPEGVDALVIERARDAYAEAQRAATNNTALGVLGQFIGSIGAAVTDDELLDTTITTGSAASRGLGATSLTGSMFRSAVIGMSAEAAIQSGVMDWYDTLELDYGWEQFAANVAAGGVIGGGLPVVGRGIKLGFNQLRRGINSLERAARISPDDANLARADIDQAELQSEVPEGVDDAPEHIANIERAVADLEVGRMPNNPNMPTVDDPLPTIADIDDVDATKFDEMLNDLTDDDIVRVVFDETSDVDVTAKGLSDGRELTGADIKRIVREDESMLDRLRGCVVR